MSKSLVISLEFAAEQLKLKEERFAALHPKEVPKALALCFMDWSPLLLVPTGEVTAGVLDFGGRGKAMLLEITWLELRQMAKRAPFWLLLLAEDRQILGSSCVDMGGLLAHAALAGETRTSWGLTTVELVSSQGSEAVAQLECGFRVGCLKEAATVPQQLDTQDPLVADPLVAKENEDEKMMETKAKPGDLQPKSEDAPPRSLLEAFFGDDIAVAAAPAEPSGPVALVVKDNPSAAVPSRDEFAPAEAPWHEDEIRLGPGIESPEKTGQISEENKENVEENVENVENVAGLLLSSPRPSSSPVETRSPARPAPSADAGEGSCTLSISALTLVSEMTRELMTLGDSQSKAGSNHFLGQAN